MRCGGGARFGVSCRCNTVRVTPACRNHGEGRPVSVCRAACQGGIGNNERRVSTVASPSTGWALSQVLGIRAADRRRGQALAPKQESPPPEIARHQD